MNKFEIEFTWDFEDKEYQIKAECEYCYDAHYGADADGNRGVPMTFQEDLYIQVFYLGKEIENPWKLFGKKEWKALEKSAENRLDDEAAAYDDYEDEREED